MRKPVRVALLSGVGLFGSITVDFLTTIAPIWIWPIAAFLCLSGVAVTYVPEMQAWMNKSGVRTRSHAVAASRVSFNIGVSQPAVTLTQPSLWKRLKRLLGWLPPPTNPDSEKRICSPRAAAELFAGVVGLTELEMERVVAPYIGKWIRVQSVIQDIWSDDNFLYVRLGLWFEPTPILRFEKEMWKSHLEMMSKGDSLASCGKIVSIGLLAMKLIDCEIVDIEGDNESFRRPSANGGS